MQFSKPFLLKDNYYNYFHKFQQLFSLNLMENALFVSYPRYGLFDFKHLAYKYL